MTESSSRKSKLPIFFISGLAIFLIVVFFVFQSKPKQQVASNIPKFDERLLACNELVNAEPIPAFETCLEVAKEGWPKAQMKLAWAYAQNGEFQDLKSSYEWVSILSRFDKNAELIRYVMLLVFGDTQEDKEFGEKGIKRLANVNYPAASAYLGILYKLNQNSLSKTSDPMWLLERAHKQNPNVFNAFQLAIIYANGFGVEKDYDKAEQVLLDYAERDYPMSTNNVAWFLATLESNPLSQPDIALNLAQKVVSNEEHEQNHIYVDTLAATFAANEDFENAIKEQSRALSLLQEAANNSENTNMQTLLEEYQARLQLYQANEKAVTETLDREYDKFFAGVKVFVERQLLNSLNTKIEAPAININTQE